MTSRRTGGRARAIIFLALSFIAAISATLVLFVFIKVMQTRLADAADPGELVSVVVAKDVLYPGETLTDEVLELKQVPPDFLPEGVFKDLALVVGRVPRDRILVGEYVRPERLANEDAGVGLNALVHRGMRAVQINITDGSAVAGFLNTGNYVDVLVTIKHDAGQQETITLLQAVYVLAVNDRIGDSKSQESDRRMRPSVTLAVTPEQAEKLTHAYVQGVVTLTLRNDVDVTRAETHGATANKLIGRVDSPAVKVNSPAAKALPAPSQNIMTVHGTRVQYHQVNPDGTTKKGRNR